MKVFDRMSGAEAVKPRISFTFPMHEREALFETQYCELGMWTVIFLTNHCTPASSLLWKTA